MSDEIKMNCPHCAGLFNFPKEGIGMTVDCPHCKQKLRLIDPTAFAPPKESAPPKVTPSPIQSPDAPSGRNGTPHFRWLIAVAIPVLIVLLTIGAFVHRANKIIASHQQGIPPKTKMPIDGLFGIKLGQPLPKKCVILEGDEGYAKIIPPETNSAFDEYAVFIETNNHMVFYISAQHFTSKEEDSWEKQRMLTDALQNQYGYASPSKTVVGSTTYLHYMWRDGQHTLYFEPGDVLQIRCYDDEVFSKVSTKWEEQRRASFDTKGLWSNPQN